MTNSGLKRGPSFTQMRSKSRRALLQALYQWQMGKQPPGEIEEWFRAEQDLRNADLDYFHELLHRIPDCVPELDRVLFALTDRVEKDIDTVELTVLRIGAYELCYRLEIPYRVVIDEAVELVKRFGSEEGYRFVNGIINRLAHQVRAAEIKLNKCEVTPKS